MDENSDGCKKDALFPIAVLTGTEKEVLHSNTSAECRRLDLMKKQGIVTFKVDEDLMELIRNIPNRSEFIRNALLSALGSICPLCNGTGIMTPNQKQHWDQFAADHKVQTCNKCNERYLVCGSGQ